jgi:hypothetical protein
MLSRFDAWTISDIAKASSSGTLNRPERENRTDEEGTGDTCEVPDDDEKTQEHHEE